MKQAVSVTVCQYKKCGRKFRPGKPNQRYCSRQCGYRQKLVRQREKRLRSESNKDYRRAPRSFSYRKKLIEWQKKQRIETTRLFLSWESFSLKRNTAFKTILRLFGVQLSESELKAVTSEWLSDELKKQRNSMLGLFHPTRRYWKTRQISSRRPDRRQKRLEEVCGKIQHAYEKAIVMMKNREKTDIFGRRR